MLFAWFLGVIGLLIGSFLNVVIYRLPRGESIAVPGSHCPACGHFLRPWELIPILSFVGLRGRCRQCGAKISWRYPLVELCTGLLFFYTAWRASVVSLNLFADLAFLSLLVALSFIDLDTMRLPDSLVIPLFLLGLARALFLPAQPAFVYSVLGALAAGGGFWLIARFYPRGMGFGDVKLAAALGAYLGFPKVFLAVFLASVGGSLWGGLMLALRKKSLKQQIPFGPYLALGAILTLYWGSWFLQRYGNGVSH
ncbi:type 4 prepilin-like proteins leader peptide-processing enzyme [Peptococcaceae bacterium CEB3]|nr:type 4 prepilin-like proteins leader peptide-processing enzyme [Peptococcaceae bacterium CEB3]